MVTSHLSKETRLRQTERHNEGTPCPSGPPQPQWSIKTKVGIKMRGLLSSFLVYMLTTKKKNTDAMEKTDSQYLENHKMWEKIRNGRYELEY